MAIMAPSHLLGRRSTDEVPAVGDPLRTQVEGLRLRGNRGIPPTGDPFNHLGIPIMTATLLSGHRHDATSGMTSEKEGASNG